MRKVAGALILVAAMQFVICMIIAEAMYAGYHVGRNYISDLGVGPSAKIFNASIILFGLMTMAGAYFLSRVYQGKLTALIFFFTGFGALLVGFFPQSVSIAHATGALMAFVCGGLSAISLITVEKSVFNYMSVAMGSMSLTALLLFIGGNYLGIEPGGMERMIAYPVLLWAIGFGGYLIGLPE